MDPLDQGTIRAAFDEDIRMTAVFDFAVWFASVCVVLAMLCALLRPFRGPRAQDRALALDALVLPPAVFEIQLACGIDHRPVDRL